MSLPSAMMRRYASLILHLFMIKGYRGPQEYSACVKRMVPSFLSLTLSALSFGCSRWKLSLQKVAAMRPAYRRTDRLMRRRSTLTRVKCPTVGLSGPFLRNRRKKGGKEGRYRDKSLMKHIKRDSIREGNKV